MRLPLIHRDASRPHSSGSSSRGAAPTSVLPPGNPESGSTTEGYLDVVAGDNVSGWAYDSASPGRRLLIEVSVGSQAVVVLADHHRGDLAAAGKGDGRHGFVARLDVAAAGEEPVHARIAESGQELRGSPLRTDIIGALESPGEIDLVNHVGVEAQRARRALRREESVAGTATAAPYRTRALTEKLFAPAMPDQDPEGIISRYLEFEFHRFKLGASFVIDGDLTERLKILHWYLAGYGPHRNLALPLSSQQIDFLNGPVPLLGLGANLSIAAYSFIRNERPNDVIDPNNQALLRESLYWWCVDKAPRFAPQGELITPMQVRALTYTGPVEMGKKFALNYFARRTHELDSSLNFLNLNNAVHRAILVCILILRAAEKPYLTQFLPRISVRELFRAGENGRPTIDRILALALARSQAGDDGVAEAERLRSAIESRLDQAGFPPSLSKAAERPLRTGAAVSLLENPTIARGLELGVAVIGPVGAASGLGQSTRLSIEILAQGGLKPAVFDFDLDNPAPKGFSSAVDAPRLRTPRQINLLHLNAESIPLAFAYIDRAVYDRSYNIGYFFWELDQIPKCHYLALDMLDEIWVSSEYNREIYERFATIPVRNVGMAVETLPDVPPLARARFGLSPDQYVFLATFDSFSFIERKNPLAVLAAFQAAFPPGSGDNARLILKTQNRTRVDDLHQVRIWQAIDHIVQRDPRIFIMDETLSYHDLLGLKKMCDCYVSLHRSEGWGFGILEAMQLGIPVIATAYSGNMDFCTPDNSYLVDYELISPMPSEYIFVERGSRWADPSVTVAAEHMKHAASRPDEARLRGSAGLASVRRDFSVSSIARRYRARLDEIHTLVNAPAAAG